MSSDNLLWSHYHINNVLRTSYRKALRQAADTIKPLVAHNAQELQDLYDYILSLSETYDLEVELNQQFGDRSLKIIDLYTVVAYTARLNAKDFNNSEVVCVRSAIANLAREFKWATLVSFVEIQPYAVQELREHDVVCSTLKSLYPNDVDESLI